MSWAVVKSRLFSGAARSALDSLQRFLPEPPVQCFIEDEVFAAFLLGLAVQAQVCDRSLGLGCVSVPADQAVQFALQPRHARLRDADPARAAPLHLLLQPPCGQQHQAAGRSSPWAPRATAAQSSGISGCQVDALELARSRIKCFLARSVIAAVVPPAEQAVASLKNPFAPAKIPCGGGRVFQWLRV